ncbi:MAG: lipocalin family protein [Acutalibacteraceae bacterium]|nr:lipocalin family protein [Acutalibacteraceae bacterium]
MKRLGATVLAVMVMLCLVLTATACGNNGGGSANSVVGTWKLKLDAEKAPENQKAMVQMMVGMMDMTMVFTNDGKVKVDMSVSAMGQSSSTNTEGTYTQTGNKIKVTGTETSGGQTVDTDGEMEIRDGKLYFIAPADSDGKVENTDYMYFEKQ